MCYSGRTIPIQSCREQSKLRQRIRLPSLTRHNRVRCIRMHCRGCRHSHHRMRHPAGKVDADSTLHGRRLGAKEALAPPTCTGPEEHASLSPPTFEQQLKPGPQSMATDTIFTTLTFEEAMRARESVEAALLFLPPFPLKRREFCERKNGKTTTKKMNEHENQDAHPRGCVDDLLGIVVRIKHTKKERNEDG